MTGRPETCVGAIAVRDDELLLVRRGHGPAGGSWSLPGGRIEWGETAAEAVLRELAEETGLEAVCGRLVGWFELIEAEHHVVVLDFEVTVIGDDRPAASDDAAEAEWVPLHEVTERRLSDGLAEFLADHGVIELIA